MATITKDLGVATAYGYHKAGGGTLTEGEFEQKMVDITTAVDDAEAARDAASNSASAAAQSATELAETVEHVATNTAELVDIRTGADGTAYSSAGAAVRTQISSLTSNAMEMEDLTDGFLTFPFVLGGAYTSGEFSTATYRIRCVFPVTEDSSYFVKGCGDYIIRNIVAYSHNVFVKEIGFEYVGERLIIPYDGTYDRCVISFAKDSNDTNFDDSEVDSAFVLVHKPYCLGSKSLKWLYGGINSATGAILDNIIRLHARVKLNPAKTIHCIRLSLPPGISIATCALYNNGVFYKGITQSKVNAGNDEIVHKFADDCVFIYSDSNFNEVILGLTKDGADFTDADIDSIISTKEKEFDGPLEDMYYNALGDSITYGYVPRNDPAYPGQLSSYAVLAANTLGMFINNYGITGSTVAYHETRNPMSRRYTDLSDNADIITFMGGTNDIRNGIQLGTMSDRTDDTFYGALHVVLGGLCKKYMIDQGVEVGKQKKIIVITPIKLLDPEASDYYTEGEGTLVNIDAWVNAVKEVANYYSLPVLDFYNVSGINPHLNRTIHGTVNGYTGYYNQYITDGTHPTQAGAYIMANVFTACLKSLVV